MWGVELRYSGEIGRRVVCVGEWEECDLWEVWRVVEIGREAGNVQVELVVRFKGGD